MRIARRLVGRHAGVLSVLLVGVVAVVAVLGVGAEGDARRREDRAAIAREDAREDAQAATNSAQLCASIESNRYGLLDLVDAVLDDDEPARTPLTETPEYAALDPVTQRFVVVVFSTPPGSSTLAARLDGFRSGLLATPLPDFCHPPTQETP